MKKVKIFPIFLVLALVLSIVTPGIFSLQAMAAETDGEASVEGMVVNKTATVNPSGGFDITLEAYATGDVHISSAIQDVPTDIVLVIDQSSSMENCIYCGKAEKDNSNRPISHNHNTYTETTTIDTTKEYYIYRTFFGSGQYVKVYYCNGKHTAQWDGGTQSCSGGAGWYTSQSSSEHTTRNKITPKTASNANGTQFYTATKKGFESRLSALNTAVNTFVESVATKAKGKDGKFDTADDVNHRIAVVGFATGGSRYNDNYPKYGNTELFIGSNQYGYSSAKSYYSSAFQDMNKEEGYKNVIGSKNSLSAKGATCIDLGIEMANGIFNANPLSSTEKRNRVMVVFTDGEPSSWDSYDSTVANNAINKAEVTKKTYGATIYTVGIFDGADPTTKGNENGTDTEKANWFMQNVSSNNGDVNNPGYYLSANDSVTLNNIFQQIADQIQGGTETTLNASAVIKDIVAPQFQLPAGTTEKDITVETWACTGKTEDGDYTWSKNATAMGATASVNATNGTVDVTGFDFSETYVGTETTDSGTVTYRGSKLVIKFTVQTKDGFLGGNDVYTNTSAGVYENSTATEPLLIFPKPTVNVPIHDVTVNAADKNVYLLDGLTAEQIKSGATATCGDVTLNLGEENYGLESWQTDYVNINVTYADKDGNTVSDLSNLIDDTEYTVSVTISPKTDGSTTTQGTVAVSKNNSDAGNINVFKPEITFNDSVIALGETADYTDNGGTAVWKHGETVADTQEMGEVPTLEYDYDPAQGAFKEETPVKVTVKKDSQNITEYVTFYRDACTFKNCDHDTKTLVTENDDNFIVHLNSFDLVIKKNVTGGIDENQSFTFHITGPNNFEMDVVIQGDGSAKVVSLPVGETDYTVTEVSDWSWRYEPTSSETATVDFDKAVDGVVTVTFTNNRNEDKWLSGDSYCENWFGNLSNTVASQE